MSKKEEKTTAKKVQTFETGKDKKDSREQVEHAKRKLKENRNKPNEKVYESNLVEALRHLSQACFQDNQNAEAYSLRGTCYQEMSDYQRALYDFTVAIKVESDYLRANGGSNNKLAEYYRKF